MWLKPLGAGDYPWAWKLTIGQARPGWRGRVAMWLRRRAQGLDGQWSLAVGFETQPPLTLRQQQEVLHQGFEAMKRSTEDMTLINLAERALADQCPELMRADP